MFGTLCRRFVQHVRSISAVTEASRAFSFSNILKSPTFRSNYGKSLPSSTVVCNAHSQLAKQNVQRPCLFRFHKENRNEDLGSTSGNNIRDVQRCFRYLQFLPRGTYKEEARWKNSRTYQAVNAISQTFELQQKKKLDLGLEICGKKNQTYQAVNAIWQTLELQQNQNLSVRLPFMCNPVMEQKNLVTGTCGRISGNLVKSTLGERHLKTFKNVNLNIEHELTAACHIPGLDQPTNSRTSNCFISKAATLFTDLSDSQKGNKKKVFRTGPDPTQLSSILLHLREEIPAFFLKPPDYSIYHPKIMFVNNIIQFTTRGIYQYRAQISGLRLLLLTFMTELSMDVLKITKDSTEGSIKVRWRIKGIPIINDLVPYIGRRTRTSGEGYRYLDGFSVFQVGSDGLIHCHKLHKVMPTPQKENNPLWMVFLLPFIRLLSPKTSETFGANVCLSTDKDTDYVAVL